VASAEPGRGAGLDDQGPAAPPRKNGELVFEAPWEARLFGLTMAMHEAGRFEWDEFRRRLIAEIAEWERRHAGATEGWSYYRCWLRAFETLLADKGLCTADTVELRASELAARPPGHDH
jgi:nitrile hydratase accessory protein